MGIRIWSFIFCCIFALSSFSFPIKISYDKNKVKLVNTIETKNCFVSYVMIKGKVYLLKQKKDPRKQLAVVRDALSAYIAECLGIAHQIDIVPSKYAFPGKQNRDMPATLHTLAPGETVRAQRNSKYSALRLRQWWAGAKSFDEKGLTRAIITYMTWHRQLPLIVALDLLIGNSDRHCGNLCYDPVTDTFCAIDMDDTFNKDLCFVACKKLRMMIQDENIIFTHEELAALKIMRDVLQFLIRKHKPKNIIEKLYAYAKKAGFVKGSEIYTESIEKKLRFYEENIIATNASARKLIALLDTIITQKIEPHSGDVPHARL
jgi:hypothetical protein